MSSHILAVAVLFLIFVVGTVRQVNLGALALVAAFLVGPLVFGVPVDTVFAAFPANLFLLVLGVTLLFAVATVNGTIGWLVDRCTGLIGDRRALLPGVLFVVTAVPVSLGALAPAGVAMLAPIALRLGERYAVPARLVALMVVFGATAGNFSPLNPLGAIVEGTMQRAGLATSPLFLYLAGFAVNVGVGVAAYLLNGGPALIREQRAVASRAPVPAGPPTPDTAGTADAGDAPADPAPARPDDAPAPGSVADRTLTLVLLVAVAVAALGFGVDIGICALIAAVLLTLVTPRSSAGAMKLVGWNIILLICGIVTYLDVLQEAGTLDVFGQLITGIGSVGLAAVLICAVGGLTSAFASSAAVIGATVPLLVPLLAQSGADPVPVVAALAICVTVVDAAPFSSIGALVLSNAADADRPRVNLTLLRWSAAMVVVGPVLTGLVLVLPATGI
ncbi:SLC13 family permease [Pseudonocardia sp. HH130630-07]|uniref:SLC13 family permease n=1 Tax=Pseudonocardia sp. HH130630-07 TaxID=1690815 RepID=UPI0008152E68|nr:SLC13 family permease [Pseudonocardia sp. HH130630-07]ANY08829.1 hypothetical protein AFB00_24080 [Pseudonocardia sp. HH130630-07]